MSRVSRAIHAIHAAPMSRDNHSDPEHTQSSSSKTEALPGRAEPAVHTAALPPHAPTRHDSGTAAMGSATVALSGDEAAAADRECSAAEVSLLWHPGDVIMNLYDVLDVLGTGATAVVYRVHHREWNVHLAVKTPRPETLQAAGSTENFEREAQTWVNMGLHPHVVSCYYVRRLGGVPRLFSEFVDGGSLQDWINTGRLYRDGPQQAVRRMVDIAIQFAWGLQFAHSCGLIHQDVKPANVMLTDTGLTKVTDFGLAKARAAVDGEAGRSAAGVTCGGMTPAYCSPEQAEINDQARRGVPPGQRRRLSAATDLWSWAVSVLEMFTGGVRWTWGTEAGAALDRLIAAGAGQAGIPTLPGDLAELLRRCLQPHPDERPSGMAEVANSLIAIYAAAAGEPYERALPVHAEALADSLNNRAVSLRDLGRSSQADACWEEALRVHPYHPESVFNRGIALWRSGKIGDDTLMRSLRELHHSRSGDWESGYYLGLACIERGDYETAVRELEAASSRKPESADVQECLVHARNTLGASRTLLRVVEGHRDPVQSVRISADGRRAVSGSGTQYAFARSKDFTLRLWDLATGTCLQVLEGHTARITSVCLSPDGRTALSGSSDDCVIVWDLAAGNSLRRIEAGMTGVRAVCFAAGGERIAAGGADGALLVWEARSGRYLRTLTGHTARVTSLCAYGSGGCLFSSDDAGSIRMWDAETGRCLRTLAEGGGAVASLSCSQDGSRLASGGPGSMVRLWNTAAGRCHMSFSGHVEQVLTVMMSADGRYVVSGGGDVLGHERSIKLWESQSGRCLFTFEGHRAPVRSLGLSADGRHMLSGSDDATLRLWKVSLQEPPGRPAPLMLSHFRASEETATASQAYEQAIEKARAAIDAGTLPAAAGHVAQARAQTGFGRNTEALALWSGMYYRLYKSGFRDAWEAGRLTGHRGAVCAVSTSRRGDYIAAGGDDALLRIWQAASGRCAGTCSGHAGSIYSVCFSADSSQIATGSADGTARLWQRQTGECRTVFTGHRESIHTVCFSRDARMLATGSNDKTVRLWNTADGRCRKTLEGHAGRITAVCSSGNGRRIVSAGTDQTIRLWDTASGNCLRIFEERTTAVLSLCCSLSGRTALSGGEDGIVRLWDVQTGRCLRRLAGHAEPVTAVCLSPDGRFAVSGSLDRTLRLWDCTNGACLRVCGGHGYAVTSVSMFPDGRYAVSGGRDETVRLWQLDWELREASGQECRSAVEECLPLFAATKNVDELLYDMGCCGCGLLSRSEVIRRIKERVADRKSTGQRHAPADRINKPPSPKDEKKSGRKRSRLKLDLD